MSSAFACSEYTCEVRLRLNDRASLLTLQVEELYSVDDASFAQLGEIYGLIFLFKWNGEKDERETVDAAYLPELFFSHQVRAVTDDTTTL
jgi:Ubiquitin carboxyl-terminal hydrolase, family 1